MPSYIEEMLAAQAIGDQEAKLGYERELAEAQRMFGGGGRAGIARGPHSFPSTYGESAAAHPPMPSMQTGPTPLEFMQRALALVATAPPPVDRSGGGRDGATKGETDQRGDTAGTAPGVTTDTALQDAGDEDPNATGATRRLDQIPGLKIMSKPQWFRRTYPEAAKTAAKTRKIKRSFAERASAEYDQYVQQAFEVYKFELAARELGLRAEDFRGRRGTKQRGKPGEDAEDTLRFLAVADVLNSISTGAMTPMDALDRLQGRKAPTERRIPSTYDLSSSPIGAAIQPDPRAKPADRARQWLQAMNMARFQGADLDQLQQIMEVAPSPQSVFDLAARGAITAEEQAAMLRYLNPDFTGAAMRNAETRAVGGGR